MLIKVRTKKGGRERPDGRTCFASYLEGFTSKRGILPPAPCTAAATAHHIKATLIPSQLPLILCQNSMEKVKRVPLKT